MWNLYLMGWYRYHKGAAYSDTATCSLGMVESSIQLFTLSTPLELNCDGEVNELLVLDAV